MSYFMITSKSIKYLLLTLCTLLMGCQKTLDSLDSNNISRGTCIVQITGYVNKSFQGQAIFENIYSLGSTYFFLDLKDVIEPGENYRIVEFTGFRPSSGLYNIKNFEDENDSTKQTLIGRYSDSDILGDFKSMGGTMGIDSSNADVIIGWADFKAFHWESLGNGDSKKVEITISTRFYAIKGNTGIIIGKKS